ncbi:hypothetical protein LTS16_002796 [Friedmanniomyces endolithicus]|nr:hypothetical protein LTR59_011600 [Friedmanniomyces endolithicus]KAK0837966.1 hypothetical protein LTR03_012363 [Friedmanniomyces endolithicus]KAK1050807.1 hypothetical protein LTS16_002796 [Friedmanniomyces endolithicus]KAK1808598.1 hypothetical protein LTR12_017046 [Friedmanniomyces endolithicus]
MSVRVDLDAHETAPDAIKAWYKRWQRKQSSAFNASPSVIGCASSLEEDHLVREVIDPRLSDIGKVFGDFMGGHLGAGDHVPTPRVFEVKSLPEMAPKYKVGLFVYPNILPESLQLRLLDKLLHRDLSDPQHQTNVHLHYDVPYGAPLPHSEGQYLSFFDPVAKTFPMKPKTSHTALNIPKMLDKKLRWMTLGGQYDWTAKAYPASPPPPFPEDVKNLIEGLFPMKAEAAIVNLYSPGDKLSVHRDVSEACAQPLVSISLGCEAIFLVALEDGPADSTSTADAGSAATTPIEGDNGGHGKLRTAVLRLRSGDAVLMSGEARYAWHGVPRVIADTCPDFMRSWPAAAARASVGTVEERYEGYRGWMAVKRVNLNVRQMFADIAVEVEGR